MFLLLGCCSSQESYDTLVKENINYHDRAQFVQCDDLHEGMIFRDFKIVRDVQDEGVDLEKCYIIWLYDNDKCSGFLPKGLLTEEGYVVECVSSKNEKDYCISIFHLTGNWRYMGNSWVGDEAEYLQNFSIARNNLAIRPFCLMESTLKSASTDYYQNRLSLARDRYTMRTKLLGWREEIYHCMYRIAKINLRQGNFDEAIKWVDISYNFRPTRNEALLLAARHFRFQPNMQRKAYEYLEKMLKNKPTDLFKVRKSSYDYEMFYEKSILDYYVNPHNKNLGLQACIDYVNSAPSDRAGAVMNNIIFYYQLLPNVTWKKLSFQGLEKDYRSSSIAVDSDKRSIIRTVDYFITPNGSYNLADGRTVNTINYTSIWDNEKCEFSSLEKLPSPNLPSNGDYIRGIEDVRLNNGFITATTREYSYSHGRNRMLCGNLDSLESWKVIKPPTETGCEKNWIPFSENKIIYSWHPYELGKIVGDKLEIVKRQTTPAFFQHFRGSSCPTKIGDSWYCIVHLVQHPHITSTRLYVHAWVRFDSNFNITGYSLPFRFRGEYGIEYCLSAQCFDGNFIEIFISIMDRESWHGRIDSKLCTENIISI